MKLITEQLQQDHQQIIKVLYHLDREITALSLKTQKRCGDKVLDILDYIQVYPELWHHPAEDIIFDALLKANTAQADVIKRTIDEHEILALLTEQLLHHLDQWVSGAKASPHRLIKSCRDYIDRQLQHIQIEQEIIFPLFSQINAEQWRSIKQQLKMHQPVWQGEAIHTQSMHQTYSNIVRGHLVTAH